MSRPPMTSKEWAEYCRGFPHGQLDDSCVSQEPEIIVKNDQENIEIADYLTTCDKINNKCEEKVLKEYLIRESEKLELENKELKKKVEELKADSKFIVAENNKFSKQKVDAKFRLSEMIKRMKNIIESFDGVNADVHSSLIVKLFRNAIKTNYSENKIKSEINKLKNPVERRLDNIED